MENINIEKLTPEEHQALVCMFFAKLPSSDIRYKKRIDCYKVLSSRFNKNVNTYKNSKDTYDYYFDANNRKGWENASISRRGPGYQDVYDKYKDYDIDILDKAVNEIIALYSADVGRFISMKCTFPQTVHDILSGKNIITVDGLYTLADKLTIDNIVFITLGGDKSNREVDWNTGFYAIAHIVKCPYDYGADGKDKKYFKVDLSIDLVLPEVMDREDFLHYRNTYSAPYIGPELKRDPSQAISTINDKQAVAVVRAVIDKFPQLKEKFESLFDKAFMDRVYGTAEMLIPVLVDYGTKIEIPYKGDLGNDSETEFIRSGENILYYGVPGSGKSFRVDCYLNDEAKIADKYIRRVVFHPEYSYSDFVGQIMPVLVDDGDNKKKIAYKFVSGPFTDILKTAYKYPAKKCCLVIEEINRGNAPAIFGEIFQLLDREENIDKDNYCGSKYKITNKTIADIVRPTHTDDDCFVEIPPNLSILATMNTSDQNVFAIDTAFQRRWQMKHIKNSFEGKQAEIIIPNNNITWAAFALSINEILASKSNAFGSIEDKSLGAYFAVGSDFDSTENFAEKVIKYLWDDAFKMDRKLIFKNDFYSLYKVLEAFETVNGLKDILLPEVYEMMEQKTKAQKDADVMIENAD